MKIYFHINEGGFSNCYLVVNEISNQAIIIDPGKITKEMIARIEDNHLNLAAVLITHNHGSHADGLKTLRKIYSPKVFAADWTVAANDTTVITGDGSTQIEGMQVSYLSIPGHTADSVVYSIGSILFTGDVLLSGEIGKTNSSYSEYILRSNIEHKIFSQLDSTILMPGHGPPTTLGAAKAIYNQNLPQKKLN
ncbi:MAG: MBL fold metallo-hydrolase [Spirochaetia bacterium]|nr:MBL fold metallo-hydrolase [Spirochaetia bacterium]MDD7610100.1 MBL fold metallo-hydrolase [Spirochaetales bacterium]MDY5914128.1 MBL fold metallo-hydrolase [Treponema sp.]